MISTLALDNPNKIYGRPYVHVIKSTKSNIILLYNFIDYENNKERN